MRVYVCSWHAIIVDGHSVEELCKALSQPRHQPTAIIAKTIKGKGIPGISHCPLICKCKANHINFPTRVSCPFTNQCLTLPMQCNVYVVSAAEDKLGWHAKPLPKDMAEMVMKDLQSRIMNSSKHLYPPAPIEDSPPVSLRNIRMPSAPNYKAGEKVCPLYTSTGFIHILIFYSQVCSHGICINNKSKWMTAT